MKCIQCEQEMKERKGKKFCSQKCKKKYKYHNNKEYRLNKIENSKRNITEKRETTKLKLKTELYAKLINDYTGTNVDVINLYNLIYNKK